MKNSKNKLILMVSLLGVVIFVPLLIIGLFWVVKVKTNNSQVQNKNSVLVKQITSQEQFKNLIIKRSKLGSDNGFFGARSDVRVMETVTNLGALNGGIGNKTLANSQEKTNKAVRVSGTNIQVQGVDEPDIIKTNGQQIFWSKKIRASFYNDFPVPVLKETPLTGEFSEPGIFLEQEKILQDTTMPPPPEIDNEISVLQAIPPVNIQILSNIKMEGFSGELLLDNKTLVSLEKGRTTSIKAYDISVPKNPLLKWTLSLEDNQQLLDSRLIKGKLYAIISNDVNQEQPCPLPLFTEKSVQISCTDIFYTNSLTQIKKVYTVMAIDISIGEIEQAFSFIGSRNMNIYVTPDFMYLSETLRMRQLQIMNGLVKERLSDILPDKVLQQINNLTEYNISDQAKELEIQIIMDDWLNSLTPEVNNNMESLLEKARNKYMQDHFRDLETTDIIKLKLSDLSVQSTGSVPGHVLNQFSFDEYQGNLRVATTSGERWNGVSESDVYILDSKLNQIGVVTALGKGEQIYAVRFVQNQGYVVTFKQVDPFYVLNLEDPTNPTISGELKIPGFSSYLHPINDKFVLGVGEERGRVKLSLFNIANPKKPKEIDKYILTKAYWSDISQNHHAFMIDPKKKIFFIPASNNGYIISYKKGKLSMVKEVSKINAQRALYIGDYLYIVGQGGVVVIDENTWEEVKIFKF